jgi:hypothetical protein
MFFYLIGKLISFCFYSIFIYKFQIFQPDLDEHLILAKEIFTLGAIPPHPLHIGSVKNHLIILFNTLFLAILGITLFRKQFFSNLEYRIVFAMLIVAFFIAFNFAD